ncbi:hypothetical protein IKS_05858 [Bacillus cereus VDM062]|nr:hypothetical protein IKS_05858 [Bacillus cereus VDM062]
MLTVFQAFSQFERDLIVQRTKEGMESARARGRKGGRPKVKEKYIEKALNLYASKEYRGSTHILTFLYVKGFSKLNRKRPRNKWVAAWKSTRNQ